MFQLVRRKKIHVTYTENLVKGYLRYKTILCHKAALAV